MRLGWGARGAGCRDGRADHSELHARRTAVTLLIRASVGLFTYLLHIHYAPRLSDARSDVVSGAALVLGLRQRAPLRALRMRMRSSAERPRLRSGRRRARRRARRRRALRRRRRRGPERAAAAPPPPRGADSRERRLASGHGAPPSWPERARSRSRSRHPREAPAQPQNCRGMQPTRAPRGPPVQRAGRQEPAPTARPAACNTHVVLGVNVSARIKQQPRRRRVAVGRSQQECRVAVLGG